MDGKERGEGWRERAEERREGGAQGGRIYWPMGGGRVGGRGRELDWERSTPPLELRIPMRKKKGGGGKVDGSSAGGYGRYQGAGHRWPEPRQKRKPRIWLEKRRSVTVTDGDGLNLKR